MLAFQTIAYEFTKICWQYFEPAFILCGWLNSIQRSLAKSGHQQSQEFKSLSLLGFLLFRSGELKLSCL